MTIEPAPLAALDDLPGYVRLFTDASFWTPYVQEVLYRHALAPGGPVWVGVPGTCPVFIVGRRWVVKFFGRLFDGEQSFRVEREAARLMRGTDAIPTAKVAASGELGGAGWPWPYLVFDYIPGVSIGEAFEQVTEPDRLALAFQLGLAVRALHSLPVDGSPVFPNDRRVYQDLLESQLEGCAERHRQWGKLPVHLIEQMASFLPPLSVLIDDGCPPHLIHADLTGDHLLGRLDGQGWTTLALIDFGDAMTGSLFYELGPLHLDLFRSERSMLRAFFSAYQPPAPALRDFPQKALATALLHRFNVFERVPASLLDSATLEELAVRLWEIE